MYYISTAANALQVGTLGGEGVATNKTTRPDISNTSFRNSFFPLLFIALNVFLFSKYVSIFSKTTFSLFPTALLSSAKESFFSKMNVPARLPGVPACKKGSVASCYSFPVKNSGKHFFKIDRHFFATSFPVCFATKQWRNCGWLVFQKFQPFYILSL